MCKEVSDIGKGREGSEGRGEGIGRQGTDGFIGEGHRGF